MKKIILVLTTSIIFASCGNKEVSINTVPTTAMAAVTGANIEYKEKPFSNPVNIEGSNFGNFFITMIQTQNYDMALNFTAKESIDKLGAAKIKEIYEHFQYNYSLIQKSMVHSGNTYSIVYTTHEFATGKIKKLNLVLENDTCKLILPENTDKIFN